MKRDDVYISHILEACERIMQYVESVDGYRGFMNDEKTQDAVIRKLEIIGEATKSLSSGYKRGRFDILWKVMAGMRDKLIHDYFGVDLRAVWKTAKEDIPRVYDGLL